MELKYAANDSEAQTIPELIEWVNGQYIDGSEHDAFVAGAGAAIDVIVDYMEEIFARCEDGRLHDPRKEMEFLRLQHYRCNDCDEELRGDSFVQYMALRNCVASEGTDWQREAGSSG